MSWKFVMKSNAGAGTDISIVKNTAILAQYKFFCYNGRVYFINQNLNEEFTGLTDEDLF